LTTTLPIVAFAASLALMIALAATVFGAIYMGIAAGAVFALTPVLWRQLQAAPASLYVLPFLTGWLLGVAHIDGKHPAFWAAAAGACLGAGLYTATSAVVMMPIYVLLTIGILAAHRTVNARDLTWFLAVFLIAVSAYVLPWVRHPELFRQTVNAFHLYDANRFNVAHGIRDMGSWVGLTARSDVYYEYFNPAFLFLSDGPLFLPTAPLLVIGVWRLIMRETGAFARLTLTGFLAAPFAAALTAEAPTARRTIYLTPLAATPQPPLARGRGHPPE